MLFPFGNRVERGQAIVGQRGTEGKQDISSEKRLSETRDD
jgi:hypothetical protein